jgi:hypothetical protein
MPVGDICGVGVRSVEFLSELPLEVVNGTINLEEKNGDGVLRGGVVGQYVGRRSVGSSTVHVARRYFLSCGF